MASAAFLSVATLHLVNSRNNGLGRLPPLGWNTWCTWGSCYQGGNLTHELHDVCSETLVKDVAQAMIDQGLRAKGWTRINLDDCWEATTRDPRTGAMRADPNRFPSGTLEPLANWLHARNFSFGVYTALGNETCSTGGRIIPGSPDARGVPGSFGHFAQDAETFASWGVDYVKLDSCIHKGSKEDSAIRESLTPKFAQALDATGRKMWLNFHCNGPYQPWCAKWGNSWRIAKDHHDMWSSTAKVIETLATVNVHNRTGAFRWPDADFIMTGGAGCDVKAVARRCPGQTDIEYRTEFSLWALGGSSMIVATDLRNMTNLMRSILLHDEVLAIHQDPLAIPGGRIGFSECGHPGTSPTPASSSQCQVWARLLSGGDIVVGFYNAGDNPASMSVNVTDAFRLIGGGTTPADVTVRNVWQRRDLGRYHGRFASYFVASHETQLYRLSRATPEDNTTAIVSVGDTVLHTVDPRFVSFTMDTGGLSSGYASGDLEASDVRALAAAVAPAYLRLSGGMADSLGFHAPRSNQGRDIVDDGATVANRHNNQNQLRKHGHCVGTDCGNCDLANSPGGAPAVALGPPTSYFNLSAWRRINAFAANVGLDVLYGLNSRARARTDTVWDGRFGMKELIEWTAAQPISDYPVVGYELGNEPDLFCRSNTTVPPALMARDFVALRARLDEVGAAHGRSYLLLGPDTAAIGSHITNSTTGNPGALYQYYFSQWADNITKTGAAGSPSAPVEEITFHQYYFKGPTADKSGAQFINVTILDSLLPKINIAVSHANASKHGASLGETASAYDGGAPGLSNSYAAIFGWVDKLGLSARSGLRRVMHQQLCCAGDGYNLLQNRGHTPTAGYWATLLWKRLMGSRVLGVKGDLAQGRTLRAYAHCANNGTGIALAVVNVARKAASIQLKFVGKDDTAQTHRLELYRLWTVEGSFTGHRTTLNGQELLVHGSTLPPLEPVVDLKSDLRVTMPALGVAFIVLPDVQTSYCTS